MRKRNILLLIAGLGLAGTTYFLANESQSAIIVETPAAISLPPVIPTTVRTPKVIPIEESPLKDSVIAAGDYLVRQQLPNGELAYQVDFLTNERSYTPSYIRLIAGAGSLYTVCRVSGDLTYCEAGDRALDHYLEFLVNDPSHFKGTCLYTNGACPLGGAALTIDAIYKRWQATSDVTLADRDLLSTASELGYFIASMRRPDGGFYHSFDPHFAGSVDPDYFVIYFPGESLYALLELYEMTGDDFWLAQAHEANDYMITQSVTEDHWHSYAFAMFARLDSLTRADHAYMEQIAQTVIDGQVRSLNPTNTSISTATKVESLAALAQALVLSNSEHEWLDQEIRPFITFVLARQLPDNNCNLDISDEMTRRYEGGVFSSCEDPSIRIDGVQHWINGVTTFLEYRSMVEEK